MQVDYRDPFRSRMTMKDHFANASRFMRSLRRMGRLGGLVATGLGGLTCAAAGWMAWKLGPGAPGDTYLEPLMVAVVALGFGLAFVGFGLHTLVWPHRMDPKPSPEAFMSFLRRATKPVRVCVACRSEVAADRTAECKRCLSSADCFVVASDADLAVVATVLAASGGSPR